MDSGPPEKPESIRDLQRRRRRAGRGRPDIEALLAVPLDGDEEDEEADEEDEPQQAGTPPPARVFVVFRGAKWQDPDGVLRESDTIFGVFATEEAARRAAATVSKGEAAERIDAWYQPYTVEP